MENSLYVALSRQMVMERQMDIIANNIANMSTPGYKGEQMMFVEYVDQTNSGDKVSFVQDLAVMRDYGEGPLTHTGNPLDLAIHGQGWFMVDTPDGPRYTRNGHFTLDQNGQLVTSDGYPVLDRQGQPIRFTNADTKIEVSGDGTVATNLGPKAQINIVTFPDEQQLHKQSSTLYSTDQPAQPALKAQVVQGMIEDSNVQPIVEMTDMIKALRSYQAAQQLIEGNDSLMRNAVNTWTEQSQAA